MEQELIKLFNNFNINISILNSTKIDNYLYFDLQLNGKTQIKDIESKLSEIRSCS